MMTFSAPASAFRSAGIAAASSPCRVRTHNERTAPATRKRELSLSPERSRSSRIAQEWSAVAHAHGLPSAEQMPWPYCVILAAVQRSSGRAAINPAAGARGAFSSKEEGHDHIGTFCGGNGDTSQRDELLAKIAEAKRTE